MRRSAYAFAAAALGFATPAAAQVYAPPTHSGPPAFLQALPPEAITVLADQGTSIERDRQPARSLAEHRRLATALATLQPQRRGVVDAYVLSVGLDSDPNFGREAREAARVLSRRYDAAGRTLVLAGTDGSAESTLPIGSPQAVEVALARIAELMDPAEDVLVLYTTSHGAPFGIVYNDADQGFGAISPMRLWTMLSTLGITNRLLLVSACYAGVFVPLLQSETTAIITAADATHTSFGCRADADWTFFGDALVNHALRKPQPLAQAGAEALATIRRWEGQGKIDYSNPQVVIGGNVARWLAPLEAKLPPATPSTGQPAITMLDE